MKTLLDRLTDRVVAMFRFDLDISLDDHRAPFDAITDELYLGARPQPAQIPALQEAKITHIVSCLPQNDHARVAFLQQDFQTLCFDLHDGMRQDIASSFPAFFTFVDELRKSRPDARLLVHCEAGVSRSATLLIAQLMKSQQKRFYEAFCDVRAGRSHVLPNIGFASQLQQLEHELHAKDRAPGELSSLARYLHEVCRAPVEVGLLQEMLEQHAFDAPRALRAIFGGEIPRVIQGVRV